MCGNRAFVRECETDNCLIHPFRFGKTPARVGKGKSKDQMIAMSQKRRALRRGKSVYFERSATG
jgi:hypothetical protein